MKSPYDIIIRPVLTEKSYDGMADKKYAFEVAIGANKTEIKMNVDGDNNAGTAPESQEPANEAAQGQENNEAGQQPTPTPESASQAPNGRQPGF